MLLVLQFGLPDVYGAEVVRLVDRRDGRRQAAWRHCRPPGTNLAVSARRPARCGGRRPCDRGPGSLFIVGRARREDLPKTSGPRAAAVSLPPELRRNRGRELVKPLISGQRYCKIDYDGPMAPQVPLGYNTYSVRAMRWNDLQLLEYAASLKLDAVYLQDSVDPANNEPAHWKILKETAAQLGFELHGGDAGALPQTPDGMDATMSACTRASGTRWASVRSWSAFASRAIAPAMPPGPVEQDDGNHDPDAARDANGGDGRGGEVRHRESQGPVLLADAAGDRRRGQGFVGSYLDTGNPVFVMEDPLATVETLGPVAVMLHLRDSVVYETRRRRGGAVGPAGRRRGGFQADRR